MNAKLKILKAEEKDLPHLNKISVEAKSHWKYPKEWIEHWMDELTVTAEYLERNFVYKLILEKAIVGFCAVEETKHFYEISHMWILPAYIGRGYGKLLLSETLNRVIKKKKDIIVVSDPNTTGFYERMNFVTVDKVESYPAGRFLPVMKGR